MHTPNKDIPGLNDMLHEMETEPVDLGHLEALFNDAEQWIADTDLSTIEIPSPKVAVPSGPSLRTTMRVPADILAAYRTEASRRGIGYQTLMFRALREVMERPGFS